MKEQILKLQEVFAKAKGERVDLGLVDDVEKLIKSYEKQRKDLDKELTNWYENIFKINKQFSGVKNTYLKFNKIVDELSKNTALLKKSAKELGIKENDIPAYKNGIAAQKRAADMTLEFLDANKASKKISGAI